MRVFLYGWAVISLLATPLRAEIWSCDFSGFQLHTKEHSDFRVSGELLFQEGRGISTDPFHILENSKTAIVAAKGGTYAMFEPTPSPSINSAVVMINKATGDFVFTIAEIGPANDRTTGKCRKK
jgi:hypothetical protein